MHETDYRRLDLPVADVEDGVKRLIQGGGLLSAEILRRWSARAIWTGAVPGVRAADLIDVAHGGAPGTARLDPAVIAFIRRFLADDGARVALFEDAVARAGDPALARARAPYVVLGDRVFPTLRGGSEVNEASVAGVLADAWSWRLVGVLAGGSGHSHLDEQTIDLANLVMRSRHVVVGAWDGEGLLVVDRE